MYQVKRRQAIAVATMMVGCLVTNVGGLVANVEAAYPPPTGLNPQAAQQPAPQRPTAQQPAPGINQASYGYAPAPTQRPGYAQAPYGQAPYGYGQAPYAQAPQQQRPQVQRPQQWPATAPPQTAPQQAYAPAQSYPRVAQAPAGTLPAPTEYVAPNAGAAQSPAGSGSYYSAAPASGTSVASYPASGSYPASNSYGSYNAGCNTCNGGAANEGSYASTGCSTTGCATTGCATGGSADYGTYGGNNYGCSDYMVPVPSSRQWFVGVYGLYMERDDSARVTTSMTLDDTIITGGGGYPYYPPSGGPAIVRTYGTDDVDFDFQGGAEIRFGSTFGSTGGGYSAGAGGYGAGGCASGNCGGCDTACGYGANCGAASGGGYGGGCGYGASCGGGPMPYAWELAYWAIANDENSIVVQDSSTRDNTRMYTTIDYRGLEYDRDGAGATYAYRPMTEYVGTTPPIAAPVPAFDPIPVAFRTRTNFSMQNLELNMLKLPIYGGISTCGIGCGGCGSCGSGCDGCGGGGCGECFQPSYSITGVCGVRYVRFDDDFNFDAQFADTTPVDPDYDGFGVGLAETEFFHQINIDNHLTGFQMGANMDWALSPCWSLFCNSQFGVYNNHMKHYQRVFENGAGNIRLIGSGGDATVRTSKDDIAFMGELRCGAAYQVSCNCRLTAAWRAVGISGVALSTNHLNAFTNTSTMGQIDSQGSLIMHGLQVGSEFKF